MNALRHFKAAGGQVGDLQYLEAEEAKRVGAAEAVPS